MTTATDGAAILKAVIDEPGVDVHRFAYADWLDESGKTMRAEWIRNQLQAWGATGAKYQALRQRQHAIYQAAGPLELSGSEAHDWLFKFANDHVLLVPHFEWFRRGFVEVIELDGRDFAPVVGRLPFDAHPIREVAVSDWSGYAQQISASISPRLHTLRLCRDLVTGSEAQALLSFSHHGGWGRTLKALEADCAGRGERMLLDGLPCVSLRLNGVLYSPCDEYGFGQRARTVLEAPADPGGEAGAFP